MEKPEGHHTLAQTETNQELTDCVSKDSLLRTLEKLFKTKHEFYLKKADMNPNQQRTNENKMVSHLNSLFSKGLGLASSFQEFNLDKFHLETKFQTRSGKEIQNLQKVENQNENGSADQDLEDEEDSTSKMDIFSFLNYLNSHRQDLSLDPATSFNENNSHMIKFWNSLDSFLNFSIEWPGEIPVKNIFNKFFSHYLGHNRPEFSFALILIFKAVSISGNWENEFKETVSGGLIKSAKSYMRNLRLVYERNFVRNRTNFGKLILTLYTF